MALRYQESFSVQVLEDHPQVELRRRIRASAFELLADDIRLLDDVRFRVRFTGTPHRVHVLGWVQTRLQLQCDRCLTPFEYPINARFESIYLPMDRAPTQSHRLTQQEDLITTFFIGDRIDLWGMVHEQILLQVPMKRLCREDCLGLCPECGVNRNAEVCQCKEEVVDPRWAPLIRLRKLVSS